MSSRASAAAPRLTLALSDQSFASASDSGSRTATAGTAWGYPLVAQLIALDPAPAIQPAAISTSSTATAVPTAAPTAGPTPTGVFFVNASHYQRGVVLTGPEFNAGQLPGVENASWWYPVPSELDYYGSKGLNLVRLPVLWERLQPSLFSPIGPTQLSRMDTFIAAAKSRGIQVMIVPFGSAQYRGNLIGSSQVPIAAFADLWTKLASHYTGQTNVSYDLMNEPAYNGSDIRFGGTLTWQPAAQAAVDAIRKVDKAHTIHVEGNGYAQAQDWAFWNGNPTFSVTDPMNNFRYDAHAYFDRPATGQYLNSYDADGAYPTIGVDRLQPFLSFLKTANAPGFVGEYGVPGNDPRWLTVLDNFMTAMDQNGLGGAYWDGGPWQTQAADPLSIEPSPAPATVSSSDRPQMAVLLKHPAR